MKTTIQRGTRVAAPIGVLLSLVIAGQALATSWSTPVVVAAQSDTIWINSADMTTLGTSTVVAVYSRTNTSVSEGGAPVMRVFARRSTNSGQTWSAPVRLSRLGYQADEVHIASFGNAVDVVWRESPPDDPYNTQIRYAKSLDGGATFGASIGLSLVGLTSMSPSVSRGPNGRVAVVWNDQDTTDDLYMRVSTDGGTSFGPFRTVFATNIGIIEVAVGDGVIHATRIYGSRISVKRSLDDGATWSSAIVLTHAATIWSDLAVLADGSNAYVTWIHRSSTGWSVRYRKSSDTGATWSSPVQVTPKSGKRIWAVAASLNGGTLRFALSRCVTKACPVRGLYYVQGVHGATWPAAEQVPVGEGYPLATGFASRAIVLYGELSGVKTITAAP